MVVPTGPPNSSSISSSTFSSLRLAVCGGSDNYMDTDVRLYIKLRLL
jgi:hypothetical protein